MQLNVLLVKQARYNKAMVIAATYTLHSESLDETQRYAYLLSAVLKEGDVISLDGDLGAGKTHFTQGLAKGLGIQEVPTSPTFNLMIAYDEGRLPLYHFDLYRLEDAYELEDIAFYDYVGANGVSCIEWAAKFEDEMPEDRLALSFTVNEDGSRSIEVRTMGKRGQEMLSAWKASLS